MPARAPRDDPRARRRAALLLAQGLRGDACDAAGDAIPPAAARSSPIRSEFADLARGRPRRRRRRRTLRRYPFAEGHEDFLMLFDPPDAAHRLVGGGGGGGRLRLLRGQGRAGPLPDLALDEQRRAAAMRPGRRATARCSASRRRLQPLRRRPPRLGAPQRLSRRAATAPRSRSTATARWSSATPSARSRCRKAGREIADIALGGGALTLTDVGGETRTVPFDTGFFGAS